MYTDSWSECYRVAMESLIALFNEVLWIIRECKRLLEIWFFKLILKIVRNFWIIFVGSVKSIIQTIFVVFFSTAENTGGKISNSSISSPFPINKFTAVDFYRWGCNDIEMMIIIIIIIFHYNRSECTPIHLNIDRKLKWKKKNSRWIRWGMYEGRFL